MDQPSPPQPMPMDPPPPPPPPVDHLFALPEHLQDEFLTRLDLRDAVRTSALAHAWRRRWEMVPGLALSFRRGAPASVVDCVLLRYTGPNISRFASHLDADASQSHVDEWLIALSRRAVESICIIKNSGRIFTIHSSIFSCDRLVSLTLERCHFPPFAGGFPVLKELYLTCAEFADDADNGKSQLEAMIRASPKLRVLLLEEIDDTYCVIEAPNLHTLGLISCDDFFWRFGDLTSLQYASINVPDYLSRPDKVLADVSHVQELILNLPEYYFKFDPIIPFTFYNLKSMELLMDFYEMNKILLMFGLLRSSPNLEKLKIETQKRDSETVANRKFLRAQWTDGMCANLKVVQIISYEGWLPLTFIKLILSKAKLLHTLSVDARPDSQDDRLDELLNNRKASPQAQVLFKDQLDGIRFNHMKFAEKGLSEGTV